MDPVTIPDTDTVLESAYEEASGSLAALLQPRKRDGTDMAVTSAACTPTRSDPGANLLSGVMDLDWTQEAALEHTCKKKKKTMSPEK